MPALAAASVLALAAVAAAAWEHAGLSVFFGLIAIPTALYAAIAVRQAALVVVAIASALAGAAVIGYWIHALLTFPWSG